MIKKLFPIFGFVIITSIFFWQFLIKGLVPIPTDTIVGLYYPYRDNFVKDSPNGLPFKNFLITDPVRQQYPWRSLTIETYKAGELPTWNSFSFSGTPNLANFQSAVFYPLNVLLFIGQFEVSWSILIILQPLLAGIFMFLYLRNLKLDEYSSFLGGVVFSFSGFFVTWLEWGTVLQSALWLPLILLSVDKVFEMSLKKNKRNFLWMIILTLSLACSFFAGHLQTFFYIGLMSLFYTFLRVWQSEKKLKFFLTIVSSFFITAIIILPQLVPTMKFIFLSGREMDQAVWQKEGWFLPWQHLIQFVIPDFFGNPSTLNYWGVWNYGELTGFAGIVAIILGLFAIIFRRDKITYFFTTALVISLLFSLPNIISKIPYILNTPFLSTAQPTRLLFIVDFALSVLAALGLNYFISKRMLKQILYPIVLIGVILAVLFCYSQFWPQVDESITNFTVAKRNIYFPGIIFLAASSILVAYAVVKNKFKKYFIFLLIFITVVELFRFSWKFNAFSQKEYLYPETDSIELVKNNIENYRFATSDPRILPPNFSIMHNLQSVEGYDPLYLERYAQLVSAINRGNPDISSPYGFNRIIRIENFSSNLVDLLGVKYVFAKSEMDIQGFNKVYDAGQTKVYENTQVYPKAFFVNEVNIAKNKDEAIGIMFDKNFDPLNQAVVEENINSKFGVGQARLIRYSNQDLVIETQNESEGFLVITDTYYPTWKVKINGKESKIYITDFNFRGVIVPKGRNIVEFSNSLL